MIMPVNATPEESSRLALRDWNEVCNPPVKRQSFLPLEGLTSSLAFSKTAEHTFKDQQYQAQVAPLNYRLFHSHRQPFGARCSPGNAYQDLSQQAAI